MISNPPVYIPQSVKMAKLPILSPSLIKVSRKAGRLGTCENTTGRRIKKSRTMSGVNEKAIIRNSKKKMTFINDES